MKLSLQTHTPGGGDYFPLTVKSNEEAMVMEERRSEMILTAVPHQILLRRWTAIFSFLVSSLYLTPS
jgi:hypothetical protein